MIYTVRSWYSNKECANQEYENSYRYAVPIRGDMKEALGVELQPFTAT